MVRNKKLFAILTLVCFMFTLMPVAAFASETAEVWDGSIDDSWTVDQAITTAGQLAYFAQQVNNGTSFSGKTVTLGADIDLGDREWKPIGNKSNTFQGVFDGNQKTISNLKITGNNSYVGLFGYTTNGEIKNLTVENANVSGYVGVGAVAGSPYTSKYTDITLIGHVEINGMSYVGGVFGRNAYANLTDITVNVDENSYVRADSVEYDPESGYADVNGYVAYRTYVGGVVGFMGEGGHKVENVTSNIDVIGSTCDVGGIAGIAHYGNSFINCICTGDVTINNATNETEIGGIAGVWNNGGANVTLGNCSYKGTLTSPGITEFANGGLVGPAYSASGTGKLVLDNNKVELVIPDDLAVAKIGDKNYLTLAEAVEKAAPGAEVTLLKDVEGAGVVVDKNITINLGGNTYTVTNPTVGSEGTKTLGFQLLASKNKEARNITIKNGEITSSAECETDKILIQNYSNLTLEDVTLDGTNLNAPKYVLSNNYGNTTIIGKTSITAAADGVAFDVYDYSSGGYTVPPTVTIDTKGTITGNFEVSKTASLVVKAGTFTVDPSDYLPDDKCIVKDTEYTVGDHNPVGTVTAPTCTEGGYTTYTCETCGDTYTADEVDALGHTEETLPAKAATCKETGLTEGKVCDVCDEVLVAQEVTEKLPHTEKVVAGKDATCKDTGLTEGKVCDVCGEVLVAQEVIPVTDAHTLEAVAKVAPTYSATGMEAHSKCTVCGKLFVDGVEKTEADLVIDKLVSSGGGSVGGGSSSSSSSNKTESSTTTTVTPSGSTVKVETETKTESDGTKVETATTTTTTTTGETTKVETTTETKTDGTVVETTITTDSKGDTTTVEKTTETNDEGTKVETTVTTDAQGETATTVTATLDNGAAVTNNDEAVKVEVTKVEETVVTKVEEAVAADETVEVVGTADNAVSVSATNSSTGAAQSNFVQPMSVNVPVDKAVLDNVTDTSKLTMAKVVTNEDGTTELVYMGGSYDEETGTFNAKVDEDGDYILVEKADLVKIELTIDDTTVKHNDNHHEMDVAPKINAEEGRTELPLRYLGEALGFGIEWNNNVVTITKGDTVFSMEIGKEIPGFGTPYIDSDRTMVSARYISEMLGANVIWDPVDRQVIVVK